MTNVTVSLPLISKPVIDLKTGLMDSEWYHFLEKSHIRSGGDVDLVGASNDAVVVLNGSKVDKTVHVKPGNGLVGGGSLIGDVLLGALKDAGWTSSTGAGAKGAYTQYPGQAKSAAYVQAEAQQTDDAVAALAARLVALEKALRANGAIDG